MFKSVDNDTISLSLRNGVFMPFLYKGHQVVAHNAAWSFREKIWVDDELIVNRIGISMTSTHVVDVAGDKLTITYGYRKGMSEIFLEAHAGNELVHEVSHSVGKETGSGTMALIIIGSALAGAVFGYTLVSLLVGS